MRSLLAFLWLLPFVVLASCIRLNEPDEFSCKDESDCRDHEKCLYTLEKPRCVPKDFCRQHEDCTGAELCLGDGTCEVPECRASDDDSCSPYRCTEGLFTCRTDCFYAAQCAPGHVCHESACVVRECEDGRQDQCGGYRCTNGLCEKSCTLADQCIGYHECKDGECVPALRDIDAPCAAASECASGLCCPTTRFGVYQCAAECTYEEPGAACEWDARCASQACVDGVCTECQGADCAEEACTLRECGEIAGVSCGECGERKYCDAAGECLDTCNGRECGEENGVSCGECRSNETCVESTGECIIVCEGWQCGYDRGTKCGECGDLERCNEAHLCEHVCVGLECGTDRAFVCGECSALEYCSDEQKCEVGCEGRECGTDHGFACGQCEAGELCEAGQCVTGTCTASDAYCIGEAAYRCSADATERTLVEPCDGNEFCSEPAGTCMSDLCTPGEAYCAGSRLTTCVENGGGGEPGGTDCATLSASCHVLGCGTLHTDEIGEAPPLNVYEDTARVGNIYLMSKTVTLTGIDAIIERAYLNTYVDASFGIYQADVLNGPYTLVEGTGYLRDGIATGLNVVLTTGKYYAIIASPRDSMDLDVHIKRTSSAILPLTVSFGSLVSGSSDTDRFGSIQPTTGYFYHQTLHTLELAE